MSFARGGGNASPGICGFPTTRKLYYMNEGDLVLKQKNRLTVETASRFNLIDSVIYALRPPIPFVFLVIVLAFSLGRNARTAEPAFHISELPISPSSFESPF